MAEEIDILKLAQESGIDSDLLVESRKMRLELRKQGLKGTAYRLSSPEDQHRASIDSGDGRDRRTVHLRSALPKQPD
jgi:hypothetical protein